MPLVTPGTGGQRAHARRPGHLRPPLGGERGRLLVADVDDVDPLGPAAVVDREQVPAREREQLAHAVGAQAFGDEPPTVSRPAQPGRLSLRLRRHEAAR